MRSSLAGRTALVVDDNEAVCTAFDVLLSLHGARVVAAATPAEGLAALQASPVDLVIQDMNFRREATGGEEGIALFHEIRRRFPDMPIILLTAWTHLETAVDLVKAGAADYVAKPWDDDRLLTTVRNLIDLSSARSEAQDIRAERREARDALAERFDLCSIVYESQAMHTLVAMATQVAHADVPVLITGPNGAGKEVLADIVQANSTVRGKPYLKVNLGALPNDLIEAELFGTEAGAFTGARARTGRFEAADGGTLFLDELGNLSGSGQAKLLRVLQTGEFERLGSNTTRRTQVRVIAATNANLRQAIREGPLPRGPFLSPQRHRARSTAPGRASRRHPPVGKALPAAGIRVSRRRRARTDTVFLARKRPGVAKRHAARLSSIAGARNRRGGVELARR